MVSAKAISPRPSAAASRTMPTTRSAGTSPSNGHPNATEIVSEIGGPPSILRRPTMPASTATCSATVAPWLRTPKPSLAQTTTLASSQPLATARSQPRSLRTSPMRETPGSRGSAAMISSAPAICGTRLGFTNETTSMRRTPLASRRRTNSTFTSASRTAFSFCRPSRGPTSTISMRALIAHSPAAAWRRELGDRCAKCRDDCSNSRAQRLDRHAAP